jgi:hypothetical protein
MPRRLDARQSGRRGAALRDFLRSPRRLQRASHLDRNLPIGSCGETAPPGRRRLAASPL